MSARAALQVEAKFMKGETGVDGASGKMEVDPEVAQQVKHSGSPTRQEAGISADATILLANIMRRLREPPS